MHIFRAKCIDQILLLLQIQHFGSLELKDELTVQAWNKKSEI